MNKAVLAVVAVAFDLGVVTVTGTAAGAEGNYLKIDIRQDKTGALVTYLKIDRVNTVQVCDSKQGTVEINGGVQYCALPNTGPTGKR